MPTSLDELLASFALTPDAEKTASDVTTDAAGDSINNAETTAGGRKMDLAGLYMSLEAADEEMKTASEQTGAAAETVEETTEDAQLDQAAEALATAELEKEASIKLAAEYDAAGRIIARGFYDELQKLAAADTHVTPGPTERPSAAKTEALGPRGVPTVPTNNAGSTEHNKNIPTAGSAPKQVYKNVLKDGKNAKPGSGVTMSPPVVGGFATIKDITG